MDIYIIKCLLDNGYSKCEAIAELNSKSVRWACDCNGDGKVPYGQYPSNWVIDYYVGGNSSIIAFGASDDLKIKWK